MPTWCSSGGNNPSSSDGSSSASGGGGQEIDSVRELNRLLESALRMGGPTTTAGGGGEHHVNPTKVAELPFGNTSSGDHDNNSNNADNNPEANAASWRLDTARRLSSVSITKIFFVRMCW